MRVLQVIDSLVPAGTERSLAAVAPHLVAMDVDLHVVALSAETGLAGDLRRAGCRVDLLGRDGRARTLAAIRRVVRDRRPDLVHTTLFESDVLGRPAARLAGARVVSSLVNDAYGPAQRRALPPWKVTATQLLDAATARLAVRFHAVSRSVADTMTARLRLPADRVEIIPRGRDDAVLGRRTTERREATRAALGIGDEPLVLAVGRHEHQKGLDVLLEAVAGMPGTSPPLVLVAGREGSASAELRGSITRLGLGASVRLLGPRDDVADLLAAADAFVLPSRWEGLPGALIEAMALEVPIVATAIPPVEEVLGPQPPARLVAVDDAAALGAAIGAALADPRPDDVAAARARFDAVFRIERVAARMHAFYRAALDG